MRRVRVLALAFMVAGLGCTTRADLEKVPIGTEVEVTRQDGGIVHGTLAGRDDTTVKVTVDSAVRTIPRSQITGMQVVASAPRDAAHPTVAAIRDIVLSQGSDITLPKGMALRVRLDSPVGSDTSRVGDPVEATLARALVVDGTEVVPSGSVLRGTVVAVRSSAKVKGRASMGLRFESISVAGRDEPCEIAAGVSLMAPATKREDAAKIAIPAAGGGIIGALIGGKKGAAIGAAVGGGGGTAVVLSTAGRQIRLARGTALSLRLERDASMRVPVGTQ